MPSALTSRARHARAWLMDAAFPFWLERGLDRAHGGYHERMFRDGAPENLAGPAHGATDCKARSN